MDEKSEEVEMKIPLVEKLQIQYPIFQAPMAGGILSPSFIASVSNQGILGSFPTGYLSLTKVEEQLKQISKQTQNNFSVNIFVDYNRHDNFPIRKPQELVYLEKKVGMEQNPFFSIPKSPQLNELIEIFVRYRVPIISTTFGLLREKELRLLRKIKDSVRKDNQEDLKREENQRKDFPAKRSYPPNDYEPFLMVTVNTVEQAKRAFLENYADAIIFQSEKAGGHLGGFAGVFENHNGKSLYPSKGAKWGRVKNR